MSVADPTTTSIPAALVTTEWARDHLDDPKVLIETAEARGVKTCGHAFDQAPLAPKGYITGADLVIDGGLNQFNWLHKMYGTSAQAEREGTGQD